MKLKSRTEEFTSEFLAEHRAFTEAQFFSVVRRFVVIAWLLFLLLDYYYLPKEMLAAWVGMRLLVAIVWLVTPYFFRFKKVTAHYQLVSALNVCLPDLCLIAMIHFDTYPSVYILGLILTHQMGTSILKLTRVTSVLSSLFIYATVIAVTSQHYEFDLKIHTAMTLILGGFIIFNFQYSTDEIALFKGQIEAKERERRKKEEISMELERLVIDERLSRSFPPLLVEKIKHNEEKYSKFKNSRCVVGFVDIGASALISNTMAIEESWDLKNAFMEAFVEEAKRRNCVPLTWTGDGFMFICNFFGEEDWHFRVAALIEVMHQEYEALVQRTKITVSTGLKFGFAEGEVIVGHLGKQKAFYNAHGPAINLAARLCSEAEKGQAIIANHVYATLKNYVTGFNEKGVLEYTPKGWDRPLTAAILDRRERSEYGIKCPNCDSNLLTAMNPLGQWDTLCPRCN